MEFNTVTLSDFVKLANVIWIRGFASVEPAMQNSGLLKVMDISEHTGNTREFSEIDTNEYLSYKAEGDQAARGKIQQGYTKTMTMYRVAENIGITYEMRTQNKYPEIINALTSAGAKGANTIDLDLSHRLTFGTATSYTDRDGRTIATAVGDTYQLKSRIADIKSFLIDSKVLKKDNEAQGESQRERLNEKTSLFRLKDEAIVRALDIFKTSEIGRNVLFVL
jgi:hypothetical protein